MQFNQEALHAAARESTDALLRMYVEQVRNGSIETVVDNNSIIDLFNGLHRTIAQQVVMLQDVFCLVTLMKNQLVGNGLISDPTSSKDEEAPSS